MAGTAPRTQRTQVAIVGAGPAGLLLAHLLGRRGVDSVAVDLRTRREIETTHRAGILERDSVRCLVDDGVSDRVLREGHEHRGVLLRFEGASHRVDFQGLVGASTWLYPQTDVFVDLADARDRDGGDVRFGVGDVRVDAGGDPDGGALARLAFTDADGVAHEVEADVLVGADGSRSVCRDLVPDAGRHRFFREYPYAWFGILAEAPRSSDELVYARSDRGFALISSRTADLQRMYFQCDPATDPDDWSDDRVWDELQARVAGPDGFALAEGALVERTVLPFRSFVQEPMRHGRLVLAGDAAHTVPPTGAKGLNLALADVRLLAEVLGRALVDGDRAALEEYSPRALTRVWRAQHFSYWMTTMLHRADAGAGPGAGPDDPAVAAFDARRQLGELETVTGTEAGRRHLALGYTGWPDGP